MNYIKQSRGSSRVHTFGIGSCVSSELIRDCAKAGDGNPTFINDLSKLESLVLEALQKNIYPYQLLKHLTFFSALNEPLYTYQNLSTLQHGSFFRFQDLIPHNLGKISHCKVTIFDPRSQKESQIVIPVTTLDEGGESVVKLAAWKMINSKDITVKKEEREALSVKY